jgi:hypothetical protein
MWGLMKDRYKDPLDFSEDSLDESQIFISVIPTHDKPSMDEVLVSSSNTYPSIKTLGHECPLEKDLLGPNMSNRDVQKIDPYQECGIEGDPFCAGKGLDLISPLCPRHVIIVGLLRDSKPNFVVIDSISPHTSIFHSCAKAFEVSLSLQDDPSTINHIGFVGKCLDELVQRALCTSKDGSLVPFSLNLEENSGKTQAHKISNCILVSDRKEVKPRLFRGFGFVG